MNRQRALCARPFPSRPLSRRLPAALIGLCLAGVAAGCEDDAETEIRDGGAADRAADSATPSDGAVSEGGTRDAADAGVGTDSATDGGGGDAPPAPPVDRDIAVVRLLPTGERDTTFGTNGVAMVDLGGIAGSVRDDLYGFTVDKMGRPVLFATKKGDGRNDQDRAVVRLTAAGQLDTSFATMGVHSLNIAGLGDNVRHGVVQDDGKIIVAGYTNQPTGVGTQSANAVVLLRLLDTGMPDTTFGATGVVNFNPFRSPDGIMIAGMTEAYSLVRQSTGNYVTVGYARGVGKASTDPVDLVVNRWSATNGALDTTFATNGSLLFDLAAGADQGRNLVVLPGDRILVVGNATPMPMSGDAFVGILSPNGAWDTTFDTDGYKTYDFMRPSESLYGVAVNAAGTQAVAVGYRSGTVAGVMEDDDAIMVLIPLGAGAESAQAVELSTTGNDRFWGVTYDAAGKIYATGHVSEGGDNKMVVVRFNADGTKDATFGTAGVLQVNVVTGGTEETSRSIVVQTDGKILIGGAVDKK